MANAARSQQAEALLRHTDSEQFEAFSAGIAPGEIDSRTLGALQHLGVSTEGLYREVLAWNFEDPVTSTKHDAVRHTLHEIHERIKMFVLVKTKLETPYG